MLMKNEQVEVVRITKGLYINNVGILQGKNITLENGTTLKKNKRKNNYKPLFTVTMRARKNTLETRRRRVKRTVRKVLK